MTMKLTDAQHRALLLFIEDVEPWKWIGKVRPQTIRTLVAAGLIAEIAERHVPCDGYRRTQPKITEAGRAVIGTLHTLPRSDP